MSRMKRVSGISALMVGTAASLAWSAGPRVSPLISPAARRAEAAHSGAGLEGAAVAAIAAAASNVQPPTILKGTLVIPAGQEAPVLRALQAHVASLKAMKAGEMKGFPFGVFAHPIESYTPVAAVPGEATLSRMERASDLGRRISAASEDVRLLKGAIKANYAFMKDDLASAQFQKRFVQTAQVIREHHRADYVAAASETVSLKEQAVAQYEAEHPFVVPLWRRAARSVWRTWTNPEMSRRTKAWSESR